MSKKKKQTVKKTTSRTDYLAEKRAERNAFIRNQPLLYIILALAAFFCGNYLFDLVESVGIYALPYSIETWS